MAENGFELGIPDELEAGVYANFVTVWHTAYEFTLDFAVALAGTDDALATPYRLVTRVRLPVTLAFEAIRTLNDEMTAYEREYGEIRPPEPGEGR